MKWYFLVDGLFWLLCSLAALVLFQRRLHKEIQAFFLILTRNPLIAQIIFALLFFPGILVHELSHLIMAKLLGVRTGGFSVFPKALPDGRLRLGYVETEKAGAIKESIIGIAPLITGCVFIGYFAISRMELPPLWTTLVSGDLAQFCVDLEIVVLKPDFWLWFYLSFTISSTMLPSSSDRHAWLPIGLVLFVITLALVLAGAGTWMINNIAPRIDTFFGTLALIFGTSSGLHLVLIPPFQALHLLIAKMTGLDVK